MRIIARGLEQMFGGKVTIHPPTPMTLADCERGDGIIVRFGSKGSQKAMVYDRTKAGNVRVFKWSERAKEWKGPIRLHEGELIRRGSTADFEGLPLTPDSYRRGAQSPARGTAEWIAQRKAKA